MGGTQGQPCGGAWVRRVIVVGDIGIGLRSTHSPSLDKEKGVDPKRIHSLFLIQCRLGVDSVSDLVATLVQRVDNVVVVALAEGLVVLRFSLTECSFNTVEILIIHNDEDCR